MASRRQLSDEAIVKTLRSAADAHDELTRTVGKMKDLLSLMSERFDSLEKRVADLERLLPRARH
jgi:hypothetical protein